MRFQIQQEKEGIIMSIKNAIKRLENQLVKNCGNKTFTFEIPYFTDAAQSKELQQKLIRKYDLENIDALIVFVTSYATAA